MKAKKRHTRTRRRRRTIIAMTVALIGLTLLLLHLFKAPLVNYLYRHRYFADAFDRAGGDSGAQPLILNFDFSLRDMEYFTSFPEKKSFEAGKRQTVELNVRGENYTVDLLPFKSYFKFISLNKKKNAFCVHFPPGSPFQDNVRQFDVFRARKADFYEQELVYHLGRQLGLYVPKTDYVNIYINFTDYGDYSLKQSFDNVFLEQNNIPDAVVFSLSRGDGGTYNIRYLNEKSFGRKTQEHLRRVPELIQANDPNLLIKYFDVDYLARFQALQELLQTNPSFVLDNNLRFIYNKVNGKLYPILDESNIYNILNAHPDDDLAFLHRQMERHPVVQEKRKRYLQRLAEEYDEIIANYREVKHKYTGLHSGLYYQLRVHLVSSYYYNQVYRRLKTYRQTKKELPQAPFSTGNQPYEPIASPRLQQSQAYLDHMLVTAHLFLEKHPAMGLTFDQHSGTIAMGPGEFDLKETMIVPLCYQFRINAGTTLRIAPGVSLVSYSPFSVMGTEQQPVVIKALDPKTPFDVVAVVGDGNGTSIIEYLDFSGGSKAFIDGVKHSAGLNFHNIDVEMRHSKVHHNVDDSGMVIKKARIHIEYNSFYANRSDQLSLDYCRGIVKGNRFYVGEGQRLENIDARGDGVSMKASEVIFRNNRLENLPDKGISVGKYSTALICGNYFTGNPFAVSVRDYGKGLVLNNTITGNDVAASAYRRSILLGGGSLYMTNNDIHDNKRVLNIDKYSRCFKMHKDLQIDALFLPLLAEDKLDEVFETFDRLRKEYIYKESQPQSFMVGSTPAYIDRENKLVIVNLPPGSGVKQKITFSCSQESTKVFLIPSACGTRSADIAGLEDSQTRLRSGTVYDFKEYIYRGVLNYQRDYQVDAYELVVTTGTLPVVEIDTRVGSGKPQKIVNEPKIPCNIRFIKSPQPLTPGSNADHRHLNHFLQARIEGRGQKWDKWKYGITFERPITPMEMPRSKRWVLESCYVEKSLMRPKVAFDLFDRFRDPDAKRIAPGAHFVEVILNGDYRGVYLLMEHIDRDFLNLDDYDKNETHNALLFRAMNKSANFSPLNDPASLLKRGYEDLDRHIQPWEKGKDPIRGWTSGFEQRHPNPGKYGEHWKLLTEFVRFAAEAPDREFSENITNYLNIERYLELWVFTQLIDDSDGLYQNRYLVREKGKDARWYFVPWDKDGILGRDYKMDKRSWAIWLNTHLFDRCMQIRWFREALKNTWDSLRARNIITEESIFNLINSNALLLLDAQQRNFRRWPNDSLHGPYPDDNDFHQEIAYMKKWIRNRIQFLYNRMIRIHNPENF